MHYIHGAEYFSSWRTWKTWATQHMSDSSSLIYALQFVAWLAQATLPSIVFKGPPRSSHRILKQDENSTWDFNLTFLICVGSWESGNGFSLDRTEPCVKASRFYMIIAYRCCFFFWTNFHLQVEFHGASGISEGLPALKCHWHPVAMGYGSRRGSPDRCGMVRLCVAHVELRGGGWCRMSEVNGGKKMRDSAWCDADIGWLLCTVYCIVA
jgi:hypothetical protein